MEYTKLRPAFSMVTAIFLIVIMSTVAIFVMNLAGKIVGSTVIQYQHEQAELYTKSYTEFAILSVTGNNRTIDCVQDITGTIGTPATGDGYNIRTHISYITNGTLVDTSNCDAIRVLSTGVTDATSPLSIIVDVYADYKSPDNTSGPWLTVHRRSIQKI